MIASLELWAGIWKWLLIVGGGAFLILMVYTIIAGAGDIRLLFASLKQTAETEGDEKKDSSSGEASDA